MHTDPPRSRSYSARTLAGATDKPLPWSLRQKLLRELREDFVRHGRSAALPEILLGGLERLSRASRNATLRTLVDRGAGERSLLKALTVWVAEMPTTHRAEWLLGRLSEAGGLRWAPQPGPEDGPIRLPRAERDKIARRFERLWEQSITRHDDDPEASEYADALDDEIERIGRKSEAFAVRALTKRFSDRSGAKTLSFRDLLEKEQLGKPEAIIRFLEEKLEIEWTEPCAASGEVERARKPYALGASYAVGDEVDHPKFGVGIVTAIGPGKVRIRFDDGERTLASKQ